MVLLSVFRFFAALAALLILAAAAYLIWSWWEGRLLQDAAGHLLHLREPWRLWSGLALLAWSFLGRAILPRFLSRRDGRVTRATHGEGQMITSATGSRLWVEIHGRPSGTPIIFTHGWGMDSTFWRYAREDLCDRFQVVTWDLPGLGRSRVAGRAAVSLEAFAIDLATVLETVRGRPAVLVGHSIGGMIIQTLLRDHPGLQSRIAGAVLLDTTYTNPLRTMVLGRLALALQRPLLEPAMRLATALQPLVRVVQWQSYLSGSAHLAHRMGFGRYVTRSQLDHVTLLSTRNSPAVQAQGNLAMFHWDATGALTGVRVPFLVIAGDMDIITKLEANRAIAQESPRGELRVVEGVNHLGPMERADIYDGLIGEFALRVAPGASTDRPSPAPDTPQASPRITLARDPPPRLH